MPDHPPLAVVDRSGALHFGLPAAGAAYDWRPLHREGRWPAWSPDGTTLASSAVITEGERVQSRIELHGLRGPGMRTLFESAPGIIPVIAPRVPHYVLWSPTGRQVAVVGQGALGLELQVHDATGELPVRTVATGAPIFSSWSPDGSRLAIHSGTQFCFVRADDLAAAPVIVTTQALGFRTPPYSSDGTFVAYAQPSESGIAVMSHDVVAQTGKEVAAFPGAVAMAFRPGTHQLAIAVTREAEAGVFEQLLLVDVDSGDRVPLARGPFVSFFWAPDGAHVVTVVPAQTGDGRYAFRLHSSEGRHVTSTESVVPGQDYRVLLGFFDQYALSHRLWSADSRNFLICGRFVHDGVSPSFGDSVGDLVLRWQAGPNSPLETLRPGDLAFYPP